MKIEPILKTGDCFSHSLEVTYDRIVEVLGFEPNVTHLDDPDKVKASWGFTVDGVRCGIWCYKYYGDPVNCDYWSFYGPKEILNKLFMNKE
jgi:uncharacterized membrane protein YgcG